MKLQEAIEIGTEVLGASLLGFDEDKEAIKLLIEAGKRVEGYRKVEGLTAVPLLSGETEE